MFFRIWYLRIILVLQKTDLYWMRKELSFNRKFIKNPVEIDRSQLFIFQHEELIALTNKHLEESKIFKELEKTYIGVKL